MDGLTAINKVSADFGISSRTLRHWEASGLFTSARDPQSGWRVYDPEATGRIRVTDLLRRLDVPVSDIKTVLDTRTAESLRGVLQKQLDKLARAEAEREQYRAVISEIMAILESETRFTFSALEDILLPVVPDRKKHILKKAAGDFQMEISNKYDDVTYVNLAPARAVAYSIVDAEPEDKAVEPVLKWIDENNLRGTMRLYGFNTHEKAEPPAYGFGYCAAIPEGIEIPEPLYEKRLPGGIYAVISKYEGDPSRGWKKIGELMNDPEWGWEYDGSRGCVGLEEHIVRPGGGYHISVMLPVREKVRKSRGV